MGASPNVLSQRLRDLEKHGVIERPAEGTTYALTDRGRELHPVLLQLGRWGARNTERPAGALSVDALMVALESTFVPAAAGDLRATLEFRLGDDRFRVDVEEGAIAISRGTPRKADAVIETDPAILRAVVFGDRPLAEAAVVLQGDRRAARTFFKLFARP